MARLSIITVALVLATAATAQQPNSASASLTFDGIDGPSWPIVLPLNVQTWNSDLTLDIHGPPLQPFILVYAPAGVTVKARPCGATSGSAIRIHPSSDFERPCSGEVRKCDSSEFARRVSGSRTWHRWATSASHIA